MLKGLAVALSLTLAATAAQAADYKAPRTAFGQPDLQGTWTNASLTTLVRPAGYKSLTIPEAQAKAFEQRQAQMRDAQNRPSDPTAGAPRVGNDPGGYNNFWVDPGTHMGRINGEVRTSWIVDPADGQLPYHAEGKKLFEKTQNYVRNTFDGPETRPLGERCILGFGSTAGPPMLNVLYNNNYQIVQTPDYVTIVVEMNHDARVIRLNDRKHPPRSIKKWMGDSVGWWEGDTLVVETTNFHPDESFRPYFGNSIYISTDGKVTERFTRVSKDQILYRFTVDDPKVYSKPWTAEMPLNASDKPVYEYACHEGNYSLPGILAGARVAEKEGRKPEAVDVSE
ncbi:hypothetical protein [Phenylobacterium sp.]|jgi:hypothetical protein|uniref:hypothetical protein n=1 Tax=Phenylobacterium sp. TaxID=1871053 RepID=UPI002F95376D